jgi:peptide/nickel transport system ATP-binding protein
VVPSDPVVRGRGLTKTFGRGGRSRVATQALRGVDLEVGAGECVALVGESGSGKTTLLNAIAGLVDYDSGSLEMVPQRDVHMVFQDAAASLTPWLSVGTLVTERARVGGASRAESREIALNAISMVGLRPEVLDAKPRQLSGGQAQRVCIARAIALSPRLLLADEPTSALDVSLAAVVLNLLGKLRRELGFSMLFVTHDLAAARVVADRIAVMHDGVIVEQGSADEVISAPSEAYTRRLLDAVPGGQLT